MWYKNYTDDFSARKKIWSNKIFASESNRKTKVYKIERKLIPPTANEAT